MTTATTEAERMPIVGPNERMDTRDERWAMSDSAWYGAAAKFAVEKLGRGNRRSCLVIGSPMPELLKLRKQNWHTFYIDVRDPPQEIEGVNCVCDATDLYNFPSAMFHAVSSTCVLCHAGLGRYGDPIKPNGDLLMLREIYRVLKPGGLAAICVGPAVDLLRESVVYGNVHRVYKPADVYSMVIEVGFELMESLEIAAAEPMGAPEIEEEIAGEADVRISYTYLSVLLRKPE